MDIAKYVRLCMEKRGIKSVAALGSRIGQSRENLRQKFNKNDLKMADLAKIAEALDADLSVRFIDNKTGLAII